MNRKAITILAFLVVAAPVIYVLVSASEDGSSATTARSEPMVTFRVTMPASNTPVASQTNTSSQAK